MSAKLCTRRWFVLKRVWYTINVVIMRRLNKHQSIAVAVAVFAVTFFLGGPLVNSLLGGVL